MAPADDLHFWHQFLGIVDIGRAKSGVARERSKGWGWLGRREGGVARACSERLETGVHWTNMRDRAWRG